MSEQPGRLTLDDLDRFLGLRDDPTWGLEGFLDAAAVLAAFDPFRLQPVGDVADDPASSLLDRLLPRCEPLTHGAAPGLWSLALPDRRTSLLRLATRERMRNALQANPDRPDLPLQQVFEAVLAGERINLEDATRDELAALLTVQDWVEGIVDDVPDSRAISNAIAKIDRLEPMRRLAGQNFVGRLAELEQLHEHVFGHGASALGVPPSLFVYGPGGVGKSTMLARFILENAESNNLRVIHIDIDRQTIRPERPATLLLDAVEQLQRQITVEGGVVDGLIADIYHSIRSQDSERTFESSNLSSARIDHGAIYGSLYFSQLQQFRDVFDKPTPPGVPVAAKDQFVVLVVVDTFEEAEYLGADVVRPLVQFLLDFARSFPKLRLVLSGRTLPADYLELAFDISRERLSTEDALIVDEIPMPHRPINLAALDEQAARDLLVMELEQADGPALTSGDIDDVIGVVSRNPMCLKLAARVLRVEGVDRLRASRGEFLSMLRAEKIQAYLYGRILHHLHTDNARAVSYPGLVVRRITPEIIRNVLAEPCNLQFTPDQDEYDVFEALRKEAALVEVDIDGSLRHRVDVRREMLQDLADHIGPEVIERIDRAAVEFYAGQSDPISRAEEIYHRLRLGETAATLDARWMPEAANWLKNVGEELPARQRLWLAGKLGVSLDDYVRSAATQEEWEGQTARSAQRYLQSGRPDLALRDLQARTERLPRSKLYFLEAEAYRLLDQPDAAHDAARTGVDALGAAGAIDMPLELLLQMIVIEEGRGNIKPREMPATTLAPARFSKPAALELLEEARRIASYSANDVLRFRVGVTRLRLNRLLHPSASEETAELRQELCTSLTDELMHAIRARPVLLREAAAELGEYEPRLVAAAIDALGVEVTNDNQAQAFARAVESLDDQQLSDVSLDRNSIEGAKKRREPTSAQSEFDADVVRTWANQTISSGDVRRLSNSLAQEQPGTEVLRSFATYFRVGVDTSLHSLVVQITDAVQNWDWSEVKRLAGDYSYVLRGSSELTPRTLALLKLLLSSRQYEAVVDVAESALVVAPGDRTVWRLYAQALVDQGRIALALRVYENIADDPAASVEDRIEARGGVGRCYKQLLLTATDAGRRAEYLQRALEAYSGLYYTDRGRYWQGINYVALLSYAARESIPVPGVADPGRVSRDVAGDILSTVENDSDPWATITACEAHIARDEVGAALQRANEFCVDDRTDAFMIAAFLRQVVDVWQPSPTSELGTTLIPLLRSALVSNTGGSVTLKSADFSATRIEQLEQLETDDETGLQLGKVFGSDRFQTLRWWRSGLLRCRAVVRIDDANGVGRGSGFLIRGSALHPALPELVVVTVAYVVPDAIHPDDAVVAFNGLDADEGEQTHFRVRRLWWHSPPSPPGVDTAVLELTGVPAGVEPIPVADPFPTLDANSRTYIIGHPKGYDQPQFSITDNLMLDYDSTRLHYRAAIEGGSGGSPVFDSQWKVIGLHHAGSASMARLDGKGTYTANEAFRIDAIRAAIAQFPPV